MNKLRILLIILFLTYLFLYCFQARVQAQNPRPYDVSITPSFMRIFIKPGEDFSTSFSLVNNGDPGQFTVAVRGVKQTNSGTTIALEKSYSDLFSIWIDRIEDESGNSLWSNPDKLTKDAEIFLKSGQKFKVYISTAVLSDAVYGETPLILLISKNPTPFTTDDSILLSVQGTTGVFMLVTITDGAIEVKGSVGEARFNRSRSLIFFGKEVAFMDSSFGLPSVDFIVQLNNTGKYAYSGSGKISVSDVFKRVHSYVFQSSLVLPYTKRLLVADSQSSCKTEENCYPDVSMRLGRQVMQMYNLTGELELGKGASKIYFSRSVIIFPFTWSILLIVLLSIYYIRQLRKTPQRV